MMQSNDNLGEPLRAFRARVGLFAPSPAPHFMRSRVVPLLSLSLNTPQKNVLMRITGSDLYFILSFFYRFCRRKLNFNVETGHALSLH
jgi:hypothetical protein